MGPIARHVGAGTSPGIRSPRSANERRTVRLDNWTTRPGAGIGAMGVAKGTRYRCIGGADWVRRELFRRGPVMLARLDGNVLPASESPAWTETVSSPATITTDGTTITFDQGDAATLARAEFTHSLTQTGLFYVLRHKRSGGSGDQGIGNLQDGSRNMNLQDFASGDVGWSGVTAVALDTSVERVYELMQVVDGRCRLWVDHARDPLVESDYSALTTTSSQVFRAGTFFIGPTGTQTLRDGVYGRLT